MSDEECYDCLENENDENVEVECHRIYDTIVIKYKDGETGKDLTPIPLYIPEKGEVGDEITGKNKVMQALVRVTNTIYALSGLGALSRGKASTLEEENEEDELDAENDLQKTIQEEQNANKKRDQGSENFTQNSAYEQHSDEHTSSVCSILLKETPTIWTISLAGTCIVNENNSTEDNEAKYRDSRDACDRWCQTIDFPRKKKGTQTDVMMAKESFSQTNASEMSMLSAV